MLVLAIVLRNLVRNSSDREPWPKSPIFLSSTIIMTINALFLPFRKSTVTSTTGVTPSVLLYPGPKCMLLPTSQPGVNHRCSFHPCAVHQTRLLAWRPPPKKGKGASGGTPSRCPVSPHSMSSFCTCSYNGDKTASRHDSKYLSRLLVCGATLVTIRARTLVYHWVEIGITMNVLPG